MPLLNCKPLATLLKGAAIVSLALVGMTASAQSDWPNKPIRLVVPYGPGSSPDVIARLIGDKLGARLGQPVIVDNRAGAGGNTGTGAVAKAAGDGYTFVISTNGPLVYNTVLYDNLSYDPFKELRPVILAGGQANVCAVRADSGIKSLKELVAAMKKQPGKLNFSSTGVGSLSQLGVELLKVKALNLAIQERQYRQYERMEANLAALVAMEVGDTELGRLQTNAAQRASRQSAAEAVR